MNLVSYLTQGNGTSVVKDFAKDTTDIWMRSNQIHQVFLNVINNALDAIDGSEKKEIHIDVHGSGKGVQITVADTGCGIASKNLRSIYEPFFTTKPVGKGTGLGLSVARSIIRAHGGEITCESKFGEGAKFKISLPIDNREQKVGIRY